MTRACSHLMGESRVRSSYSIACERMVVFREPLKVSVQGQSRTVALYGVHCTAACCNTCARRNAIYGEHEQAKAEASHIHRAAAERGRIS